MMKPACQALTFLRELRKQWQLAGVELPHERAGADRGVAGDGDEAAGVTPIKDTIIDQAASYDRFRVELGMSTRIADARGLTKCIERQLTVGASTTAAFVQANPQRRMFACLNPGTSIQFAIAPGDFLAMFPLTTPGFPSFLCKEDDWGSFVQLAWFVRNDAFAPLTLLVWEEIYINSPLGETQWNPEQRGERVHPLPFPESLESPSWCPQVPIEAASPLALQRHLASCPTIPT